jgi:hypothetical protein
LGTQAAHVQPQEDIALKVSVWAKWTVRGNATVAQFRIEAQAADGVKDSSSTHPTAKDGDRYLRKLDGCTFGLDLTGSDHFSLGSVPLVIQTIVDDSGLKSGFRGTGAIKLTPAEYRDLVQHRDWSLTWSCPLYQ